MTDVKVGDTISATTVSAQNPADLYDTPEERAEGCFIGKIVSNILLKFGYIDENGFCSTYREWHIFTRGIHSGFSTSLTDKFKDCPDMWYDEIQYYEAGQEIGYVIRNAFIFLVSGVVATETVTNAPTILTLIKTLLGW